MKARTDLVINKDGSVDYSRTSAVSTEVMEMINQQGGSEDSTDTSSSVLSDEEKKEAKEKGYKEENYDQDGFKGVKLSKHFDNISELASEEEVTATTEIFTSDKPVIFTVKKGDNSNIYKAKITWNKEKDSNESIKEYKNNDEYKEYFKGLDISFNVTLPTVAKSSNATSTDGNTLTWDFTKFNKEAIEFEFEIGNNTNESNNSNESKSNNFNSNTIIIIVGGALALAAIVICVIALTKKKQNQ